MRALAILIVLLLILIGSAFALLASGSFSNKVYGLGGVSAFAVLVAIAAAGYIINMLA
jgi:hypothetical protein